MKNKSTLFNHLIQALESYVKSKLELLRLKATAKFTEIVSAIMLKLFVVIVVSLMSILINIGIALWIGELMGEFYWGFIIVSAFYVIIALLMIRLPNILKSTIKKFLISEMLSLIADKKEQG
ncbi:MAG: hypothetical protein PHE33_04300 [Bacteroidales bacterium]|nr:hypothetical protein [Bacteroidales bacterium]